MCLIRIHVGIGVEVTGSDWGCYVVEGDVGQVTVSFRVGTHPDPAALTIGIFVQEVTVSSSVNGGHFVVEGSLVEVETSNDVGHL